MRRAGEEALAAYERFSGVSGSAEATILASGSVDFVTAAQAAHWFDLVKAKAEFIRILKPHGWVVLLWNERRLDTSAFLRDYEQLLLTYATDYKEVRHELTTAGIEQFFAPATCNLKVFNLVQQFDRTGLEGRLLSSSYAPPQGHPGYEPMMQELRRIFDVHQIAGRVALDYDTRVYYGQLT
jgi:SAM-dependent methyltransferase